VRLSVDMYMRIFCFMPQTVLSLSVPHLGNFKTLYASSRYLYDLEEPYVHHTEYLLHNATSLMYWFYIRRYLNFSLRSKLDLELAFNEMGLTLSRSFKTHM
jgi:hypothetical protein